MNWSPSSAVAVASRAPWRFCCVGLLGYVITAVCWHRAKPASRSSSHERIARIILGYVQGILEASPYLRGLIKNRTQDTIELANRVSIEVRPCNFKTLRGPTYIAIVADEVAFWFTSTDFANPDVEVLAAVRPGLLTTRGPLMMVSSAYAMHGELYDAFKKYYGAAGPFPGRDPLVHLGVAL
jgi:hypothetical protein